MKSSSSKNPYNNTKWRKLRLLQLQDTPLCEYCAFKGKIEEATTVDHAIPFTEENDLMFEPDNLLSACRRCHSLITVVQQNLDFTDMSFTEAKTYKISKIPREVNANGYY